MGELHASGWRLGFASDPRLVPPEWNETRLPARHSVLEPGFHDGPGPDTDPDPDPMRNDRARCHIVPG